MPLLDEPLQLFNWLFGESADLVDEAYLPRLRVWGRAARECVEETGQQKGHVLGKRMEASLRDFFGKVRRAPWEITTSAVEDYARSLRSEGRLAKEKLFCLALFYTYCDQHRIDPDCEAGFNPTRSVKRQDGSRFGRLVVLTQKEVEALLQAVDRGASLVGRRDYAMIQLEMATALPISTLRNLQWGDLDLDGNGFPVTLTPGRAVHEGEKRLHAFPLPPEAARALLDYLSAAGRLKSIRPEDHLFAGAACLVPLSTKGKAEARDASRLASYDSFHRMLKLYADWAGLDPKEGNWKVLRHTAMALYLQAGHSLEETLAWQGKQNNPNNRKILHALQKVLAAREEKSKEVVEVGRPKGGGSRPGGKRGKNQVFLHGFQSRYIHASERKEFKQLVEEEGDRPFGKEIAQVRLIMMRVALLAQDCDDPDKLARYLSIASTCSKNLAKLIRARKEIDNWRVESGE